MLSYILFYLKNDYDVNMIEKGQEVDYDWLPTIANQYQTYQ
jgi:hypothetical protein